MEATPRLSVCMIVRDEARLLPRCLDSLAGLYDELCVVDTGSTDGTVEWLRAQGARVVVDTSCNDADGRIADFAAARAAALALAEGDWVLQIDADEVLEAGRDVLRERIHGARGCIGVTLRSNGARWISGRLFSRADARGYHSPIHEYLEHDGEFAIARDIVIHNLPDKHGKETSYERNVRILEAALGGHPDEGRLWHFLGNEHYRAQRIAKARDCYTRALELGNFRVGRYHGTYYLGCCRLILGDRAGAIATAREAIAIDPRYAEAHCLLGDALYLSERRAEARNAYQAALDCGGPPWDAVMAVQDWTYDAHPRRQIARIDAAPESA